jgi:hypothetical protein
MREKICSQEIAVARAVRTGLWDSALRDHAAGCAACKDLVVTVTTMRSLAAGFEKDFELPEAGWLWRKALLEQKQADANRAQRPLLVAEFASVSAIILTFAAWIGWYWPEVQEHAQVQLTLSQTEPWARLWQAFWSLAAGTPQPSPGPFLLVLLLAIVAVLAVCPLLVEE